MITFLVRGPNSESMKSLRTQIIVYSFRYTTKWMAINTAQMILGGGAQTLTEAGTKSNCLQKCWAINEGCHFHFTRWSRLPTL
jgi:hypothetical protein